MSPSLPPAPPTPTESIYPNDVCQFFQSYWKLAHVIKENRVFEISVYQSRLQTVQVPDQAQKRGPPGYLNTKSTKISPEQRLNSIAKGD